MNFGGAGVLKGQHRDRVEGGTLGGLAAEGNRAASLHQAGHSLFNLGLLLGGGQRTHGYALLAWVADHHASGNLTRQGLNHLSGATGGHQDPADSGALLASLSGHLH